MFDIIGLMLESLVYTSHHNLLEFSSGLLYTRKLAMAEDPAHSPSVTWVSEERFSTLFLGTSRSSLKDSTNNKQR